MTASQEPGSFRDPAGNVYKVGERVFRTIKESVAADYEYVRDKGLFESWAEHGLVVAARETDPVVLGSAASSARYVIEHSVVPFISYPYEWPFSVLKAAALFHLDLQLRAFDHDVKLVDASAFNVQFVGLRPVFIDVLSFRRYHEGEYWTGHRQFCEQFLNPLLLQAYLGIPYHAWYRGNLEGIATEDLARLLPLRRCLSLNTISHVLLPARLQRAAVAEKHEKRVAGLKKKKLPRQSYRGMLVQLRDWIARLQLPGYGRTAWSDYESTQTYASQEISAKKAFIAEYIGRKRPDLVWDLGCNTGEYAKVALASGASYVIGFDFDHVALEKAFARASSKGLNFLPLFMDAANPSPGQGWRQAERQGLTARANADGLIALAFIHHLAIGRNVPLPQILEWLVGLAPSGVIEFVEKTDTTVQRMLAMREDIFDNYSKDAFVAGLTRCARIVKEQPVSVEGRTLFWYERNAGR